MENRNNYVTPEKQADFLAKNGHLEGIIISHHNRSNIEKLFTFRGRGFRVIIMGNAVVQIIATSEDEIKLRLACANIKFGGF